MAVNPSTLHERLNMVFQTNPVTNQTTTIAIQDQTDPLRHSGAYQGPATRTASGDTPYFHRQ